MIQSILFFVLGFLCAGFLALLIAPTLWRRAVALTKRRLEASMPLTANELHAQKDRLRAEHAMATRKLEIGLGSARDEVARQLVQISRNREEFTRLASEGAQQQEALTGLKGDVAHLRTELRRRDDELRDAGERTRQIETALAGRERELEELRQAYDDMTFQSGSRQIELAARESEIAKLGDDVARLREQRKDAQRRMREVNAEQKAGQDALKLERRRVADLETRLERTMASLSDREDELERRLRELERLRAQMAEDHGPAGETAARLTASEAENGRLRAQLEGVSARLSTDAPAVVAVAAGPVLDRNDERGRLRSRLVALTRENKQLQQQVAQMSGEGQGDVAHDNAVLREQISDLAAEVVHLTARLEGPDSPVRKALEQSPRGAAPGTTSLADRVKALQKAAPAHPEGHHSPS